eukprot:TRINITY_DN2979_c0_g4_i1.p2 TRINITY_DN2979_c0_g4~~TRINITY_DN2979_c0_g4_i1.p2  ORF type:complete len:442 (-),score=67.97 TRINITY_DN2979_c0_g4_i1:1176-2501(-)
MKSLFYILGAGLVLTLSGCMNASIEGSGTPQLTNGEEIIHGSFYGFKWKESSVKKAKDGLGLYRIIYHTNYLYSSVAVLSLGLYVPQEIEWWVQAPVQQDYDGPTMPGRKHKQRKQRMDITPKTRQHVILFDGTGNTADIENEITNVVKLSKLIAPKAKNPPPFYEKGVGTRVGEEIPGNAWGNGISERLVESYRWLTDQLNSCVSALDNFQIYIFGFSRGSYIARVFCWLLYRCGVPGDPNKCEELCQWFEKKRYDDLQKRQEAESHIQIKEIDMLGLWDTVKSAAYDDYNDNELAPNVKQAYHAMSIDELRAKFPVLRFQENKLAREIWFAGIHSDIGGGYEDDDGLSNITLKWMIENAIDQGLEFKLASITESPLGIVHDEYNKLKWKWMGKNQREIRESDLLHLSVKTKMESGTYIPLTGLPQKPFFVEYQIRLYSQ